MPDIKRMRTFRIVDMRTPEEFAADMARNVKSKPKPKAAVPRALPKGRK